MTGNVTANSGLQNVNTTRMTAGSANNEFTRQIAQKQQSLKSLSSDSEMSPAKKEKERQKLQQQIAELNRELRRQQEEEKAKAAEAAKQQEKKAALREEMLGAAQKTEKADKITAKEEQEKIEAVEESEKETAVTGDTTLPPETVQELMAVDFFRQQEITQNNMAKQREQQKDIIESEMAQDSIRGVDNAAKEEVLSKMKKKEEMIHQVQEYMNNPLDPTSGMDAGVKIVIRED